MLRQSLIVAGFAFLSVQASASEIRYQGFSSGEAPPGIAFGVFVIPDVLRGGTVTIDDLAGGLPPYDSSGEHLPPPESISGDIHFQIGSKGSNGSWYYPLSVNGHYSGTIDEGSVPVRYGGSYKGTISSIDVIANEVAPGSMIPPELIALANHPERIHINGILTYQFPVMLNNSPIWETTITIDPASAFSVPEPTPLTFLITTIGVGLFTRIRRKSDGGSLSAQ